MSNIFNMKSNSELAQSLKKKSKKSQIEEMREWFFENYEDPANSCPYESREGGYYYIYGGPYDANEELQSMFSDHVNIGYIEELVDELQHECFEWSGRSDAADWYDDDIYDAVSSVEKPLDKFTETINKIKGLSKEHINHKDHLLGILYANVITALETLYVELFIGSIDKSDDYVSNCIEKGKTEFKVNKEIISMPFKSKSSESIKKEIIKAIKEHLINASWHDSNKVIARFKNTFGINVQSDWPIKEIGEATLVRNHLVHRGGKDKNGEPVVITEENLEEVLNNAVSLGRNLDESLYNAFHDKSC